MDYLTLAAVVILTPWLGFFMWSIVKAINRRIQPLIPQGRIRRALNTRLYKAIGEPRD